MAETSLSKNLEDLNFSHQQIEALRPLILQGYRMADFLGHEIKKLDIKETALNLVKEWNLVASQFLVMMLRDEELQQELQELQIED